MLAAGLRVVQHQVTLTEGAALGVLAGQPQRDPLGQQRREGQRLGVGPVDAGVLGTERLATLGELAGQLAVDVEALGNGEQLLVEDLELVGIDRSVDLGSDAAVELVLAGGVLADALLGRGQPLLEALVVLGQRGRTNCRPSPWTRPR